MYLFHWIAGGLLGLIWLSRLMDTAFGISSVVDIAKPEWDQGKMTWPKVSIVVPAKDECECIEQCLTSLLALDYTNYEVIAVNDRSTDSTGEIMGRLLASQLDQSKSFKVIHVPELPERWLGKTHAMWLAGKQAAGEWILFTDGDIIFRPDSLRRAMAYVQAHQPDHLVLYPTPVMKTPGERMMISFFQIMFIFGHRAWKVSDPKARDHIGVGAFNLIRRSAYEAIGTYEALRLEVIDDLKLGQAVKQHGFLQHNVFGYQLICLRWAKGALGIVGNLTKNLFALMRYQWPISLAAGIGLAYLNIWPFVGIWFAPGLTKLGYAVALASLAILYAGMARFSKVSPVYFFTHPISAVLAIYTLWRSTWLVLSQGEVTWRGTKYSVKELRNAQR